MVVPCVECNSVYHVDFGVLVKETLKHKDNHESNVTRMWQRLTHAKSIYVHLYDTIKPTKMVLQKFSLLRYVEMLDVLVVPRSVSILKMILFNCANQVKSIKIRIAPSKENALSPLPLPNANCINIGELHFYRLWSNRCRELILYEIKDVSYDWCKFVIDNCGSINIEHLQLRNVTFDDKLVNKSLLQQFASKFTSIKRLEIFIRHQNFDRNVLLLWQLLNPVISTKR